MEPAIRTQHLTKVYGGRVIAVNDMNLEIPQGAVFGLLGPNGAGKTTTLRLLLGLQRPTAGYAEVFGHRCGAQLPSTVRQPDRLSAHEPQAARQPAADRVPGPARASCAGCRPTCASRG